LNHFKKYNFSSTRFKIHYICLEGHWRNSTHIILLSRLYIYIYIYVCILKLLFSFQRLSTVRCCLPWSFHLSMSQCYNGEFDLSCHLSSFFSFFFFVSLSAPIFLIFLLLQCKPFHAIFLKVLLSHLYSKPSNSLPKSIFC
jgi:hypothetical protein